jgi:D-alanine-D-alanine ligase
MRQSEMRPGDFGRVAVLMGGQSAEREISLRSGTAVLQALQARGVAAAAVDATRDIVQRLMEGGFNRVFIALHGRGGEDGVIQGLLEVLGLPYTGSGVLASALAMDKLKTKQIWQGIGLPTPEFVLLGHEAELPQALEHLGLPLMIKPVREGSSIGMTKVVERQQLLAAYRKAAAYDPEVIAERWIDGAEYTASLLGEQALPLIRLETPRAFYDYEAKYSAPTTRYLCPCGLPVEQERSLQGLAWQAFRALGGSSWGRVDLMLDGAGRPWLLEVNTIPGLTDHSLVPMAARHVGIGFEDLVLRILETSLAIPQTS